MSAGEPERDEPQRLTELDLATADPLALFGERFAYARARGLAEPTAMTLATVDADGRPNARTVLLKGVDDQGFLFFTNYDSRKGHELKDHPHAALVWFWQPLGWQARARGAVEKLSAEESDRYFARRPRGSQLGAWASPQSHPIGGRHELMERYAEIEARFADGDVPRPSHWGGYRVSADEIELWEEGAFRLHDRVRFTLEGGRWRAERLAP